MNPAAPSAGRSRRALAFFAAVFLVVLAADLALKYAAFEYVADRPVTLVRSHAEVDAHYQEHGFERYVIRYDDDGGVLATQPPIPVLPKLLQLRLTTNTGAVFGLGAGKRWVFIAVSIVATLVIGFLFLQSPPSAWGQHVALALILAGALGNLYDRVIYGAVRDMLHMLPGVHLPFGLSWPGRGELSGPTEVWPWVFNLADVALLMGVAGVLWYAWRTPPPNSEATSPSQCPTAQSATDAPSDPA